MAKKHNVSERVLSSDEESNRGFGVLLVVPAAPVLMAPEAECVVFQTKHDGTDLNVNG